MFKAMLGMLAETSVHPGVGRNLGVIDLPVAREAATDYPVIPGSSLKGALKQHARLAACSDDDKWKRWFGEQDNAGELLVSDARLLLLPVRSLTGAYRWVTCPQILERLARDRKRLGVGDEELSVSVPEGQALVADDRSLFLEEREFIHAGPVPDEIVPVIGELVLHETTRTRLERQIVVLNDEDFAWFARYGLPVQARNQLDQEKKTSNNLWYEETLPPDTLMYAMIAARVELPEGEKPASELFSGDGSYLQAGGNETVGQGWFAVRVVGETAGRLVGSEEGKEKETAS